MPDTNPENYAVINIINGWIDLCGATKESLATFFKRSSSYRLTAAKELLDLCMIIQLQNRSLDRNGSHFIDFQ